MQYLLSLHFLTLGIFIDLSHQIQNNIVPNNTNITSRQNFFHHIELQFQYRPDLGGPWGNGDWQLPVLVSSSSRRPNYQGVGSATTVRFPGPVKTNYRPTTPNTPKGESNSRSPSDYKFTKSCKCGIIKSPQSKGLSRITGGIESKENAWPWMAALVYIGGVSPFWFCGASLINEQYLITAAHCQKTIIRRGMSNVRILLGSNGIPSRGEAANLYEIVESKTHPMYKPNVEEYDIGVIKLKQKVTFSDSVSPICLTQKGSPFTDRLATVAGWGSISYGDSPPDRLREVQVKVVPNGGCHRQYMINYNTRITSAMLCAWLPGKDSCQGDSGGPLFLKQSQAYTQIGVVSFGPPQCGETRIPGVYTRVASTIRWIKANTRDAAYCEGSFDV